MAFQSDAFQNDAFQITSASTAVGTVYDWPNPRGYLANITLRTWTNSTTISLIGKDTFFGAPGQPPANLDWPVPKGRVPAIDLRTWIQSLKLNLLGKDLLPFRMMDWPLPQRPVPSITLRSLVNSLVETTLSSIVRPFAMLHWPVPWSRTPNPSLRTHIDPLRTNLYGKDQFFGVPGQPPANLDWPVPQPTRRAIALRSWAVNLLQGSLAPFSLITRMRRTEQTSTASAHRVEMGTAEQQAIAQAQKKSP
jgi:hypothetical protein